MMNHVHGSHSDWKNGTAFSSQGKSQGNFAKTGKSGDFTPCKILENQKKLYWKVEKDTRKVGEICQPVIVKTLQISYHTLNKKTLKSTGKL